MKGFDIKNLWGTDKYLFLEKIMIDPRKPPMARMEFEIGYDKSINRETRLVKVDDDLFALSKGMEQYRGYVDIGEYYGKSVKTVCSECSGTGFNESVNDYKIDGVSIATAVEMPVSELKTRIDFSNKALQTINLMESVHLGYLSIGRNIGTLSGGENQRIKLVMALTKKEGMIIGLDEPVKGLSSKEISSIIELLYAQIRECNKTFIVIEHNTQFISAASYVSELIHDGDHTEIVYSDCRAGIDKCKKSLIRKWI